MGHLLAFGIFIVGRSLLPEHDRALVILATIPVVAAHAAFLRIFY